MRIQTFIKGKELSEAARAFDFEPWQKGVGELNLLFFFFAGMIGTIALMFGGLELGRALFGRSALFEIVSIAVSVGMLLAAPVIGLKVGLWGRRLTQEAIVEGSRKRLQTQKEDQENSPSSPSGSPASF